MKKYECEYIPEDMMPEKVFVLNAGEVEELEVPDDVEDD